MSGRITKIFERETPLSPPFPPIFIPKLTNQKLNADDATPVRLQINKN